MWPHRANDREHAHQQWTWRGRLRHCLANQPRRCDHDRRVREEDSETPYLTGRGMQFIADDEQRPWLPTSSFIKPHWPYMAPAPYHAMFGPDDCLPARTLRPGISADALRSGDESQRVPRLGRRSSLRG